MTFLENIKFKYSYVLTSIVMRINFLIELIESIIEILHWRLYPD